MAINEFGSYMEAEACFEDVFVPVMEEVKAHLNRLKGEIQNKEEIQKNWNIWYSICGCMGGTITIAALAFAPLAAVGFALGTTSSVASLLHISVKMHMINKRLTFAERSLERFKNVCEDMKWHLVLLNTDIEEQIKEIREISPSDAKEYKRKLDTIAVVIEKIDKLLQHPPLLNDDMISKLKQFGKSLDGVMSGAAKAAKVSTKALGKTAAVSIIVNLTSLILDYDDLYNFGNGRLCDEAHNIEAITDKIQCLNNYLIRVFQ